MPGSRIGFHPGKKNGCIDELPPTQETAIQEVLYIIATPWQAEDIDQLYGDLYRAPTQARRNQLRETFLQRLRVRAGETINASYYAEFAFKHEG